MTTPANPQRRRVGRPRLVRPTVHDLDTSPVLVRGRKRIALDDPAFTSAVEKLHTFAVDYELGSFLVIAEKRRRGGTYFVARAYSAGKRASHYLGRAADISTESLREAAKTLIEKLRPPKRATEPSSVDVEAFVAELVARETDPERRATAQMLAELIRNRDADEAAAETPDKPDAAPETSEPSSDAKS